jgi:hypothetical protein
MLRVTRGQQLTTAITGSHPRPLWYDVNLRVQSFKSALGDSMLREQYMDAVAAVAELTGCPGCQDRSVIGRAISSLASNSALPELCDSTPGRGLDAWKLGYAPIRQNPAAVAQYPPFRSHSLR